MLNPETPAAAQPAVPTSKSVVRDSAFLVIAQALAAIANAAIFAKLVAFLGRHDFGVLTAALARLDPIRELRGGVKKITI